jgi:hypothetical protein
MRPLQQYETATLSVLKAKNFKEGAYTRDAGDESIKVLGFKIEKNSDLPELGEFRILTEFWTGKQLS